MPTPPIPIDSAPSVPSSAAPEATFDAAYEAFNTWEAQELQPKANALAQGVYDNAVDSERAAAAAQQSAIDARNAAAPALAAANFTGLWTEMSGPLNKPACVKHQGRFWMLLNDLADVATSEPGVSADWTSLDAGERPSQVIATDTTAIAGVRYLFGAGVRLTLPVTWAKDDYTGWRVLSGVQGASVYFGSARLWGVELDEGILLLDLPFAPMDLTYENPTWGLK